MQTFPLFLKRGAMSLAAAAALAGSFYAGAAYAADARLDQAQAQVTKAIALLEAAENPDKPKNPFGGHRDKAVRLLRRAQSEIAKAKAYADAPAKTRKPKLKLPAPKPVPKK